MGFLVYNDSMKIDKPVILASGSPRRLEIIKAHGIEPTVIPADVDETVPDHMLPSDIPSYLAELKAKTVYESSSIEEGLIIGADTIVYLGDLEGGGVIMGKPGDPDEGFEMLSSLRNRSHYVITGVCLVDASDGKSVTFSEITKVTFGDIPDNELKAYLESDEAYDKAGGYAIQGTFGKYVTSYEGSYDNVIGFPWSRIEREIDHFINH